MNNNNNNRVMHVWEKEGLKEEAGELLRRYGRLLLKKGGHHKEKRGILREVKKLAKELSEV